MQMLCDGRCDIKYHLITSVTSCVQELHYPRGRMTAGPPVATKVGRYPIAVVPGQFQDYYRRSADVSLRVVVLNSGFSPRVSVTFIAFDTVSWVTGKASDCKNACANFSKSFSFVTASWTTS